VDNFCGSISSTFSEMAAGALSAGAVPSAQGRVRRDVSSRAGATRRNVLVHQVGLSPLLVDGLVILCFCSGQFETVDAELLFCMVRVFKPKNMVEVMSSSSL
jgi:hypothetical protein